MNFKYFAFLFLFAACMLSNPNQTTAQLRNFYQETFAADTTSGTETITFTPSKYLDELCSYAWVLQADHLSGTMNANIILEIRAGTSGSLWAPVDTVAVSSLTADKYYVIEGNEWYGAGQRISIAASGTHSVKWNVQAAWKRRED